jgi:class 3 adenylate cyclase
MRRHAPAADVRATAASIERSYTALSRRLATVNAPGWMAITALTVFSVWGDWNKVLVIVAVEAVVTPFNIYVTLRLLERWGQARAETARALVALASTVVVGHLADWPLPLWFRIPFVALAFDHLGGLRSVLVSGAVCALIDVVAIVDDVPWPIPLFFTVFAVHCARMSHVRYQAIRDTLIHSDAQRAELERAHAALGEANDALAIRNRFIQQTFGRYLSDDVVAGLLETPGGLDLGGETRRVTIMMADLRGFTPLCETLEARQVTAVLNNFLGAMTEVILRHGGTVDEFVGDAILAVFGAPVRRDDDALRAVACAVEMQQTMAQVNARSAELGLPRVAMGIGLNTGEVVVGNIGSDRRAKYGVVGKHVNLTSRIESYTIGGQILAAESTIQDAGGAVHFNGPMESQPKGAATPVTIYDVVGVGAPYDRHLAFRDDPLVPLRTPVAVRFLVLHGKSADGERVSGALVAMSSTVGRIRTSRAVPPLENLKVELDGDLLRGVELWGKTVASRPPVGEAGASFDVWFVAIPDEVRAVLMGGPEPR